MNFSEKLLISIRFSLVKQLVKHFYQSSNNRWVDTSEPHLINELRYQPQGECLTLSEQRSLIKTLAYQFRLGRPLQEFSQDL